MEILFICAGATILGTFLMARWHRSQGLRFVQIANSHGPASRVVQRPNPS